jgi:hypothetical protein
MLVVEAETEFGTGEWRGSKLEPSVPGAGVGGSSSFGRTTSRLTLALVACGTFGGVLFTAIYLREGATRAGYDAIAQPISALGLGPGGWLQQANFVAFGTLVLASSIGWRRLLAATRHALAYPITRAVVGAGLIVDGLFSQDPGHGYPPGTGVVTTSLGGTVHNAAAFAAIVGLATGCFILARCFSADPAWRNWAPFAAITGVLTLAFITAFGMSGGGGGAAGVFERLAGGVNAVFSLAVLVRLIVQFRGQSRPGAEIHRSTPAQS